MTISDKFINLSQELADELASNCDWEDGKIRKVFCLAIEAASLYRKKRIFGINCQLNKATKNLTEFARIAEITLHHLS